MPIFLHGHDYEPTNTMDATLNIETVSKPKPYCFGSFDLYFATPTGEVDESRVKIWKQLTGRTTIRPSDIGLIADLTEGRIRIKY